MNDKSYLLVQSVGINATPVYVCDGCGLERRGNTARLKFHDLPSDREMKAAVTPDHIPDGWAAYGRDVVKCPACKD